MENRVSASLSTMAKSGLMTSQGDQSNLLQSLVSDLKPIVLDQKFFRPGEQKKAVCSIFGLPFDDTIPANINSKAVSIPSLEDLKHVRAGLVESMNRARDRGKAFGEAASKINKHFSSLLKKRYRADVSGELSSGGSMCRSASQITNELEPGILKSEERAKGPVPSRRIRTSMLEPRMDVRANAVPKPPGFPEKDRDAFKAVSGGGSEEKARAIPSGVDGWEKPNMKKKRSVIKSDVSGSSLMSKLLDGDREPKRGMQQKPPIDTRPRISNGHGFRSGSVSAANVSGSSDLVSSQNAIGIRSSSRVDQDLSGPHDRRHSRAGLDKEGASHRSGNRLNSREDGLSSTPCSLTKLNPSARGPRSNSSLVSKSSQNSQRSIENSEHLELPQCTDRVVTANSSVTRKRSTSTQSFSPPVAQWGGQRPQKISRAARRSNAPSLVSCHDGLQLSDPIESSSFGDDSLEKGRHISSNTSQQNKLKIEFLSTAGLSESDDSGIADNSANNKIKKCSEIEEKASHMMQKNAVSVLPPRRAKIGVDEDLGESSRKQGRCARASVSSRSNFPATLEKSDNAITTKPMRSGRLGSDKVESKLGRPSNKKLTERKGYARSKQEVDSEVAGESDDDYEELLAAANAALETKGACSTSFWKQIEPVFASISADDEAFLNEQVDLRNASLSSSPSMSGKDNTDALCSEIGYEKWNENVDFVSCTKHDELFLEQIVQDNGAVSRFSICHALLSAIIEKEEVDRFYSNPTKDEYLPRCSYGLQSECDAGMKEKALNVRPLNADGIAANGYMSPKWRYYDEVEREKFVRNDCIQEPGNEAISSIKILPNGPSRGQSIISNSVFSEVQYSQMSVTDRILLELNGIGIFPDPVPDLAQSEDEDILEGINSLNEKLQEQVKKKRNLLLKVEKAVALAKESQDRELESIAMSKHVARAYEKYMQACSKNANRVTKQATLGFVRRALSRYREFELTGSSCFREPVFKNIFCSAPSGCLSGDLTDVAIGSGTKDSDTGSFGHLRYSDVNSSAPLKSIQRTDTEDRHCIALQPVQMHSQEEQGLDRARKRELSLDDVVGANTGNLRPSSDFGCSLSSGTKGKRSERDGRGHNRDATSRGGTVKVGYPSASNAKGERKNKSKPKQRTAQLTASVNGLVCKSEINQEPHSVQNSHGSEDDKPKDDPSLPLQDLLNDNDTIDFNTQLSEFAGSGIGGQGQDFSSWLSSVDEDSLQGHNFMGLDIPMDDLSEVMMM